MNAQDVSNATLLNILFIFFIDIIINIVINSSKTGAHCYVVPIGDFNTSKTLRVQPSNTMQGKIYTVYSYSHLSYTVYSSITYNKGTWKN